MLLKLKSLSLPRVVIAGLLALVVATFLASLFGGLDPTVFTPTAMAASLTVFLGVSLVSSWALGWVFSSRPSLESAAITGLILWFLYWPSVEGSSLTWFAGIAVLAQASKYVIVWRGRHLVNPVVAGMLLSVALQAVFTIEAMPRTSWWIASEALFWPVVLTGVVVLWRSGRLMMSWVFVVAAGTLTVQSIRDINAAFGNPLSVFDAITFALYSTPIVFFAAFMLSEPITMPSRKPWQPLAAFVAAFFATAGLVMTGLDLPFPAFLSDSGFEWALVATGLLAAVSGQRSARLTLQERRDLVGDAVEYRWHSPRPLRFRPGQYVELDIAHRSPDSRGRRRAFSPVSQPGEALVFATRHPEPASSFKRELAGLQAGDTARVTAVHGDFYWPKRGPILLIGAGIGVTPFISQLAAEPDRDVVVVIGLREEGQPYLAELRALAPRLIELPVAEVTLANLQAEIPDMKQRKAFISGRPEFVQDLMLHLQRKVRSIHTDYFWGS